MQIGLCAHTHTPANTPLLAHKTSAARQSTVPAPCSEMIIPYVDAMCEVTSRNKETVTAERQIEFREPLFNLATTDFCNSPSFCKERASVQSSQSVQDVVV